MNDTAATERCWREFAAMAEPALATWHRQTQDPEHAQLLRLRALMTANAGTEFGRAHGFESIRSFAQYRERVPISRWSDVAPWIERDKCHVNSSLTAEAASFYERTSGSSATSKHIPYTPALISEVQRAVIVWLAQLYRDLPCIANGRGYWALSPSSQASEVAPNGTQIGNVSDAAYIQGSIVSLLLPTVLTPAWPDPQAWRSETLAALVRAEDLSFLSLWSPTFLTALLQSLLDRKGGTQGQMLTELHARISATRLRVVERALADGTFSELWPRLAAISVWMDGPSAQAARHLQPLFPQATWLSKGLLATEGVVSFSWGASGLNPLAVNSHVLEFVDERDRILDVGELRQGERYKPVISTGGGLYRYRLGDVVEVVGVLGRTPCVRFVGREDARCDLVGEKLDESLVARAFERTLGEHSGACLVPLPDACPRRYLLLLPAAHRDGVSRLNEEVASRLSEEVEVHLQSVFHYSHARRMGQLEPLVCCVIESPGTLLQRSWEAIGLRAGDAKPRSLVTSLTQARAIAGALRAQGVDVP